jgi:hypothetical protein
MHGLTFDHSTWRRPRINDLAAALLVLVGCQPFAPTDAEGPGGTLDPNAALLAPGRVGFDKVADALVGTCGTLDCHGHPARNMRLYGSHGMRLRPLDDPGGAPTSAAERDADYWSVTGLEPEVIDSVVRARGDRPERLSLFRKGLGIEKHKGGTVALVGGALDRCLRSWLQGKTDEATCEAAVPRREMPSTETPPAP